MLCNPNNLSIRDDWRFHGKARRGVVSGIRRRGATQPWGRQSAPCGRHCGAPGSLLAPLAVCPIQQRATASIRNPTEPRINRVFGLHSTRAHLLAGLAALTLGFGPPAGAENDAQVEEITVIGARDVALRLPGSGTVIDAEQLDADDYVDLNQVLSMVPGVYVREEEGFGLRPNIGIRGASAERSQKVTLMEDGVLIGPAPYSAPAAYYLTNTSRMHAVEILKGPAAISTGPHTVGGSINFVTRPVPKAAEGVLDMTLGTDGFHKLEAMYGSTVEMGGFGSAGFLADGLLFGSDGFKTLDAGGGTGFDRDDVNLKLTWRPDTARRQSLTLKLGRASETADESYLGLTDADFDADPTRRYAVSQLDHFETEHRQIHLHYGAEVSKVLRLNARFYRNEFERVWNKFDGLIGGPDAGAVLRRPDLFSAAYRVMTGQLDSDGATAPNVDVTENDRWYVSTGVQLDATWQIAAGATEHSLRVGLRHHFDDVARFHQQRGFLMRSGRLMADGVIRLPKVVNYTETTANALHVTDEIRIGDVTVLAGVRLEEIDGELASLTTGTRVSSSQRTVAPGLGVFWQVTPSVGLLAGLYQGYSPAGPGLDVDPEESLNLEYGLRYDSGLVTLEAVGFFSNYDNLLGRCRVSDPGCNPGEEFNGGAVEITGLEATANTELPVAGGELMAGVVYTYTQSSFQSTFLSGFSQWGLVRQGDELPYLPQHQARFELDFSRDQLSLSAAFKYQAEAREVAGGGGLQPGLRTEAFGTLDLSAGWRFSEVLQAQLLVRNATDESAIVAHRPFGARPNLPRTVLLRVRYTP